MIKEVDFMQILFNQVIPSLILSAFLLAALSVAKARLLAWSRKLSGE